MKTNEKMELEARIHILENALRDISCLLIDIDMADESFLCGVYARCAYSRAESALANANATNK